MTHSTPKGEPKDQNEMLQMNKLRELLFGQQFEDHEKRYVRLEEKIKKEFDDLRSEISLRLKAIEDIEKNSIRDFEEFKKNTTKIENDLRQITLDSVKDLSVELSRIHKNVISELAAEVKVLDDEKINKTALATMLGDLVVNLSARPKGVEKNH